MDHSQACCPGPESLSMAKRLARPVALKPGPLPSNYLKASILPQIYWRGLSGQEDLKKLPWQFSGVMTGRHWFKLFKFPSACKMPWFWRSFYRTSQKNNSIFSSSSAGRKTFTFYCSFRFSLSHSFPAFVGHLLSESFCPKCPED